MVFVGHIFSYAVFLKRCCSEAYWPLQNRGSPVMTMSWFALFGVIRPPAIPVELGHYQWGRDFEMMVEREDLKSRHTYLQTNVVSISPSDWARSTHRKPCLKKPCLKKTNLGFWRLWVGELGGVGKSAVVGAATPASVIQDQWKADQRSGDEEEIHDKHGHKRERLWTERRWDTRKDRADQFIICLSDLSFLVPACNVGTADRWGVFCISEGLEEQTSGCSIFRRLMVTKRDVWSCYPENVRLKLTAVVQVVME